MDITSKLETIKHRWEEMGEQLADPGSDGGAGHEDITAEGYRCKP